MGAMFSSTAEVENPATAQAVDERKLEPQPVADEVPTQAVPQAQPARNEHERPGKPSLPMKRKRKNKSGERKKRDNRKSRLDPNYVETDERKNAAFSEYYRVQRIVPADEYEKLLAILATPLPTSFRIVARGAYRKQILETLRGPMTDLFATVPDASAPVPISWMPEDAAWLLSAPRQTLRRDNVLSPFHRFLVATTELGGTARQEAVSMIPPLMLDVRPGDSVLDLCAAPGSKTGQLVEALCNDARSMVRHGLVVANDAEIKRCWMLAHQLKRFSAPQLVVTNHDAQYYPRVRLFDRVLCDVPCSGDGTLRKAPDLWRRWVPNMGLGLHRTQVNILLRGMELTKPGGTLVYSTCSFNPIENEAVVAAALRRYGPDVVELVDASHKLQDLKRRPGLASWRVPDVGGRRGKKKREELLAMATENKNDVNADANGSCSAPIDVKDEEIQVDVKDDDVQADVMDEGMQVDASGDVEMANGNNGEESNKDALPGWFTDYSQVPRKRSKVVRSMFPPSQDELASGHFPLERCMRLVPYDQNCGGFFVAVFEKKLTAPVHPKVQRLHDETTGGSSKYSDKDATMDDVADKEEDVEEEGEAVGSKPLMTDANVPQERRKATRLITDDPLIGVENLNVEAVGELAQFFGLDESECRRCLMTRGADAEKFKRVVLVSPAVRGLLRLSVGGTEADDLPAHIRKDRLRVVHAGVPLMERTTRRDTACPFRIVSDGAPILARTMRRRVVMVGPDDLGRLVRDEKIPIASFALREARQAFDELESGSALVVDADDGEAACVWKAKHSVSLLIGKMERNALVQRTTPIAVKACEEEKQSES